MTTKLFCRSLTLHVDRLHQKLRDLHARLRDTLAHLIGDSVADAMREAIRDVLVASPVTLPPRFPHVPSSRHRPGFFGSRDGFIGDDMDGSQFDDDPDDRGQLDEPYDRYDRLDPDDDEYDVAPAADHGVTRASWTNAVATGGEAAFAWLRRRPDRSIWKAAGVGLVAGVVTLASGLLPGITATLPLFGLLFST